MHQPFFFVLLCVMQCNTPFAEQAYSIQVVPRPGGELGAAKGAEGCQVRRREGHTQAREGVQEDRGGSDEVWQRVQRLQHQDGTLPALLGIGHVPVLQGVWLAGPVVVMVGQGLSSSDLLFPFLDCVNTGWGGGGGRVRGVSNDKCMSVVGVLPAGISLVVEGGGGGYFLPFLFASFSSFPTFLHFLHSFLHLLHSFLHLLHSSSFLHSSSTTYLSLCLFSLDLPLLYVFFMNPQGRGVINVVCSLHLYPCR